MDDGELAGKTALVIGSTRGLGRSVSEALARDDCTIVVSGREIGKAESPMTEIADCGGRTWEVADDLSSLADAHRLGEAAIRLTGLLDILANNAGMSIREKFGQASYASL